jgi:hypothetical protein
MEWVNIKERYPEDNQRVLCYNGYIYLKQFEFYDIGHRFYDGDIHWNGKPIGVVEDITHWMPIPAPPSFKKIK